MYQHQVMRVNYTTYDVRREEDVINPNTDHCNIMLLSADNVGSPTHRYIYARVLGIYHVNVIYVGSGNGVYQEQRMEFLWVRWYSHISGESVQKGWAKR